jgi:hypothetical protein
MQIKKENFMGITCSQWITISLFISRVTAALALAFTCSTGHPDISGKPPLHMQTLQNTFSEGNIGYEHNCGIDWNSSEVASFHDDIII